MDTQPLKKKMGERVLARKPVRSMSRSWGWGGAGEGREEGVVVCERRGVWVRAGRFIYIVYTYEIFFSAGCVYGVFLVCEGGLDGWGSEVKGRGV